MSSDDGEQNPLERVAKRWWDQTRDPFNVDKIVGTATGAMEDYKEVSGAKAAEDATALARQQYEEQKAAAEAQRVEGQAQQSRDQLMQSQKAGAARNATRASANKGTAISGSSLADENKDFLGL